MGYIYINNNLIGSIDEKGSILKDNAIVGFAKNGLVYNLHSLLIGSYHDNQVFDINNISLGSVNPKGQVNQDGKIVGDVLSCEDKNQAAAALLLLLSFKPAYLFTNNIIEENNISLLKELTLNINMHIKECMNYLADAPSDDSNPIHFKRISKKIDIFMDEKWEEFLSLAATDNEIFSRLLKVYPDLLKHLSKQYEFDNDNHFLNFTMAVLAFNGAYVQRNITYAIQTLFKSAKESYDLAIKLAQSLFSNTNLIDNLNYPLHPVYTSMLSKQEVYEMIEYLERTFPIKAASTPLKKITIANIFTQEDVDGYTIDKITKVNDVLYSDSWLNIIASLITNNKELGEQIFDIISPLPEGLYNLVKLENSNNPYILYLYGLINIYGIKTKENQNEGLRYIKFSADLGYDLAVAFLNNTTVNSDFNSSSYMRQVNISSNSEVILGYSDEFIRYLKNNLNDSCKKVNLYNSNVESTKAQLPITNSKAKNIKPKKEALKNKDSNEKDQDKKKKNVFAIIVIILVIACIALGVILSLNQ